MTSGESLKGLVEHLRAHLDDAAPDRELLTRYAQTRDEEAFTALVRRHGGMVLGVARRQLADLQQADDVFQATFLALARSASRLRTDQSLVNWLHTVAVRQARKLRLQNARRTAREQAVLLPRAPSVDPLAEITGRELLALLDEEVARLPERYRVPLLLCSVQGMSRGEAAEQLGWSAGMLKGRLERARRRLAARLSARGLSPSTLLLAPVALTVPNDLLARTAALGASPWSASLPSAVVSLAAIHAPRKLVLATGLVASLVVAGVAGLALGLADRDAPKAPSPPNGSAQAPDRAAAVEGLRLPAGMLQRFGGNGFRVTGWPLASTLSHDSTRLAVLSSAQGRGQVLLTVFDAQTGQPVCRAATAATGFFGTPRLAFSPDGKYLAAAITGDVRVVWAAATGEVATKLPPTKFGFNLCQFTPDGLLVVTDDQQTDLYEIPAGKVAKTWPVGRFALLTPDGKTFVRVEKEFEAISIGEAATGAVAGTLAVKTANNGADNGLALSRDGKMLAIVHDRKVLQLWDVATRNKLAERELPNGLIDPNDPHYSVAFAPDGQSVVLDTKRGEIERWDTRFLDHLPSLHAPWAMYIRGVHWSKDGQTILAVADTGLIHRWDAKTRRRFADEGYNRRVRFAVTRSGNQLVVGDHAGRIDLWDVATGRVVRPLARGQDMGGALLCLALSPDGRRLAVGEGGGQLRVYPADGGKGSLLIAEDREIAAWFRFLEWAPDGQSLFAGDGKTIRRLNSSTGEPVWKRSAEGMPWVLTSDGRSVIITRKDCIVWLDAAIGKDAATVPVTMTAQEAERDTPLWALALAPDGKRLAVAAGRSTIVVCDSTGREQRRFAATERKHFPPGLAFAIQQQMPDQLYHRVEALAFTPDGKWIVSGGEDFSVKVWEAATGKLITRFDSHDSSVQQLSVAPDGRSVFSASNDGFVGKWDLTPKISARRPVKPEELWTVAADADPAVAIPATWALVTQSDESRAFVAETLPPAKSGAPVKQIAQWLADLDAPAFADREAATKSLAALGRTIEPQLREAIRRNTSLEVRRRAEGLIARFEQRYTVDELRVMRIVQACELSGGPAARAMLQRWAGGVAGAMLTEDARAAVGRVARRTNQPRRQPREE